MSAPALSIVQPEHGGGDGGGMTVFEMVRAWQQFLEVSGRASALTRSSYRYALLRFFADVLVDPREITEQMVVDHQLTLDPHGSTRNDQLRALKSFYRWAAEAGIVRADPMTRLRIPRRKLGRALSLSEEQLTQLVEAARQREPRRAWAILFVYGTGARIGSACAVRPQDVHDGRVHFRVAKNGRPYDVPIEGVAKQAYEELLHCPRPDGSRASARHADCLIGVGTERFRQWVREAERDSGVRAWPHLLRDTFATRIYDATKDAMLVAELLNHRDLSQIPRYVAVDPEAKRAAILLL